MEKEHVFRACEDGSVYSRSPAEWREMLQAMARAGGPNPSVHSKVAHCGETIRHLIALEDARQNQRTTLRWARFAAYAAIVGVAVMLGQCAQSYFGFRAHRGSAAPSSQVSSPSR